MSKKVESSDISTPSGMLGHACAGAPEHTRSGVGAQARGTHASQIERCGSHTPFDCGCKPLINVRTVISPEELAWLRGDLGCGGGDAVAALGRAGVPRLIAEMVAVGSLAADEEPRSWAWIRDGDGDAAAARAVRAALAVCRGAGLGPGGMRFAAAMAVVEEWMAADLYGVRSRSVAVAAYRGAPVLVVAGVGETRRREEAEALLAVVEHRRQALAPTVLASALDGAGVRAAMLRVGAPAEVVERLIRSVVRGIERAGA